IAYTLQIIAQRGANPTVMTILLSLECVFGTVAGAIYLHEVLRPREYIGCALVLFAVILSQLPVAEFLAKRKKRKIK
ncbi:MAG: EamA family transporter, partial [Oscillospiraceae bacterium]|nr:EamA family transporter [Oscillospiraceae bacterium]